MNRTTILLLSLGPLLVPSAGRMAPVPVSFRLDW